MLKVIWYHECRCLSVKCAPSWKQGNCCACMRAIPTVGKEKSAKQSKEKIRIDEISHTGKKRVLHPPSDVDSKHPRRRAATDFPRGSRHVTSQCSPEVQYPVPAFSGTRLDCKECDPESSPEVIWGLSVPLFLCNTTYHTYLRNAPLSGVVLNPRHSACKWA
ncbi:hypothetical protein OH77DRAFT_1244562 [Trametes cingulata]|nr:hypothetical protein OH77DRAFT_1244562 [Trametes cingulata]